MKTTMRNLFAALGLGAVLIAGSAGPLSAQVDVVAERITSMKQISKAAKEMRNAAKAGDKASAIAAAKKIAALGEKVPAMFQIGTDRERIGAEKTRAKMEIWNKWNDFTQANNAMIAVANKVAGGDLAAAGEIGRTCGGCHKPFRGPKAK